jgi:O-antigen/teichoic acid export membrane protein
VVQKNLTRVIGEGTAWTLLATFFVKIVSISTIFIMLRGLTVYEYGVKELVLAALGFFGIFSLPGLVSVVIADIGIEKGKGNLAGAKGLFWSLLRLQTLMSLIAFAILFFGAEIIGSYYPEHISSYFRILAFTFPLAVVGMAYGIVFGVTFRYREQSFSSFFQEFFKLIVFAICLYGFGLKVEAVLYSMIFGPLMTFIVQYPAFRRAYRELGDVIEERVSVWHTLYEHGKWSVFSTYLNSSAGNLYLYIIKAMLGTEVVALYAVASGLVGHTSALVPIGNVVAPIIPQYISDRERFRRIITKSIKYQVVGSLVVAFGAMIFFPPIITFLFPKYVTAMPLYRIMVFGLILSGIASIFSTVFFALRAQKNLFYAVVVKTVAMIVIPPICIYFFGMMGIAYASIIVGLAYVLERYRVLRRLVPDYRFDMRMLFAMDDLDRTILAKLHGVLARKISFINRKQNV